MTDTTRQDAPPADELQSLVPQWLDWSACASALHLSVSRVRQLVKEHQLAAAVPETGAGQHVPADFVVDGQILKGVPGVLTVLHDGGFDDRASITWLFSEDDSLPGRPIDALKQNRGREVRRRAQAMAF